MERRAQLINSSCYQNPVGGLGRHGDSSPIGFKEADEGMRNGGIRRQREQDRVEGSNEKKKKKRPKKKKEGKRNEDELGNFITFFSPQPIEKE